MLFNFFLNFDLKIDWDHIESFYFVSYLPKTWVSQMCILQSDFFCLSLGCAHQQRIIQIQEDIKDGKR